MADLFVQKLHTLGQQHIVQRYNSASQEEKTNFRSQFDQLDALYPGGLAAYVEKGRKLLKDSKQGVNPYEGLIPSVPKGVTLDFNDDKNIIHYQTIGEQEIKRTGFVLVAGGLGERLGYKGIKVQIPMDTATQTRFLHYYISYIIALQNKLASGKSLPLAIMTSDDTHSMTEDLLKSNNYYGMDPKQITIVKQEKVPSIMDSSARLTLDPNRLAIQTKPYGHGQVHRLLYANKLTSDWQKKYDTKWIVFFQDTNPLMFRSIIATLGVSKELDLEMNTVGIKIKPGEAVGGITKLTSKDGKELVVNVEYNQLTPMLKQLQGPTTDKDGYLVLPGNTNGLVFNLEKYHNVLEKTKGIISEFINPKYTDNTMTAFKSPTRLQCMMQDYPKLLENCENVGFTSIDRRFCFSSLKNDPKTAADKSKAGLPSQSASSCESDIYECNRLLLRLCGAQIQDGQVVEYHSIKSKLFPRIYLSPNFAVSLKEMKTKVKKLKVSGPSTLIVLSDCVLQDVEVDGTLKIEKEGNIIAKETNQNYCKLVPTEGTQPGWQLIRGYKVG